MNQWASESWAAVEFITNPHKYPTVYPRLKSKGPSSRCNSAPHQGTTVSHKFKVSLSLLFQLRTWSVRLGFSPSATEQLQVIKSEQVRVQQQDTNSGFSLVGLLISLSFQCTKTDGYKKEKQNSATTTELQMIQQTSTHENQIKQLPLLPKCV